MRSMTWTAPEYPRTDEPFTGPERPMLDGFLDWYRASFLMGIWQVTAGRSQGS